MMLRLVSRGVLLPHFSRSLTRRAGLVDVESEASPVLVRERLIARFQLTASQVNTLRQLTDMRLPSRQFPFTLAMKRRIICHLGPTNSGKTFAAIEQLKAAGSGIYCAPLRLLAQEMYDKLNAAGTRCALRTGEVTKVPVKHPEGAERTELQSQQQSPATSNAEFDWNAAPTVSCTVEMLNLRRVYRVAVIDEIQLLSDSQRGWAFTQALLGCNAERLYLCGEPAARPLIEQILRETGEEAEFVQFERLTPLTLLPSALPPHARYEPGDCVVTFSRRDIFQLKETIERRSNGLKCAVVYGALPAENRALQAARFNDPTSDTSILVASDAIGMGLNLGIRRIIFDRMDKFDGRAVVPVAAHQIRQIAGRAGRFNTAHEAGLVTCARACDYPVLRAALKDAAPAPYQHACIAPNFAQIEQIQRAFPQFALTDILDAFVAFIQLPTHYFLSSMRTLRRLLVLLRDIDCRPLELEDLFTLVSAPVKPDDATVTASFLHMTRHFVAGRPCPVTVAVPDALHHPSRWELLRAAEAAHKSLEIYLWINTRFPHHFPHRREAEARSAECSRLIEDCLVSPPVTRTAASGNKAGVCPR